MAFWLTFCVGSVRTWSSSAHFETQISENSLRSSSSSTHLARLLASVEAMKRLYSSTVGGRPTMSIDARRRKVSSSQSPDGAIRSFWSLAATNLSM